MNEQIFISYSRDDKKRVFAIKNEIESQIGTDKCWIDLNGIESDQQFVDVIINAIKNCTIFIFMYSKNSDNSIWSRREIDFAFSEKKRIVFVNIDGYPLSPYYRFCYGGHDIIDIDNIDQKKKFLNNLIDWCGVPQDNDRNEPTKRSVISLPKDFTLYMVFSILVSIPMALGWMWISGEQHHNISLALFATFISIIVSNIVSLLTLVMTTKWNLRNRLCNLMFLLSLNFLVLYVVIAVGLSFIDLSILRLNLPSCIIATLAIMALFLLFNHQRIGYYLLCFSAIIMCASSYFWMGRVLYVPVYLFFISAVVLTLFTVVLKIKNKGQSTWSQLK